MMHNMVHPQEIQLPIEDITSPLGAHLEFSESELFPETLQNSEAASNYSSNDNNCCYNNNEEHSSYPTNLSVTIDDMNHYNATRPTTPPPPPAAATGASTPTTGFFEDDQLDNDIISAAIDFNTSPSFSLSHDDHQYLFDNNNNSSNDNNQNLLFNNNNLISLAGIDHQYNPPPLPPVIPAGYKEESGLMMSSFSAPSYNIRLMSRSSPFVGPMNIGPYLPSPFSFDGSGIFAAGNGLFLGNDISLHQELEFQGDNIGGIFQPDSMARIFSCSTGDLQALSSESQHHVVHGSPISTTLASDISSLDDPNFKVGKLSAEERKRKIHRYLKKRNQRNFSKKIKYACRKTLADSRPRVRGRFAKNDELAEIGCRATGNNHEDIDTDEDCTLFSNTIPHHHHQHKDVKGEDLESTDILAHISGVNSFKCNYPIQSWI